MQGVILAAGKGTRLQPVTPARTKAMAPVAGKPIVARVLDLFVQNGIRDILLLVSPDDPEIQPYFEAYLQAVWTGAQCTDELSVKFIVQHERLGMAHALTLLAPYLHGDFLMSACDNLVPTEHIAALIDRQRSEQANAVLSLMEIDIAHSATTGIVAFQPESNWIERIVEKPQPADAPSNIASLPLYCFSHKLLDYLPRVKPSARGEYELQDAIQMLVKDAGKVTGVLTPTRWQLTNVADLLDLNRYYLSTEADPPQVLTDTVGTDLQLQPSVRIDPGTAIGEGCIIGPHVYIEADCQIGDGCRLQNCIVLKGATVAPQSTVTNTVIL